MARETSSSAYTDMRDSGVLGSRRWEVYDWLYHNGPATPRQMTDSLTASSDKDSDCYRPRLAELQKMGLIKCVGEAICDKTNRKVIVWDVTDKVVTSKYSKDPLTYRLEELGYKSPDEYYQSEVWNETKAGYYSRHPKVCAITGRTDNVDLHHIRYDNLGCEKDEDLIPLCREMHELLHKLVKEYKVPLEKAHLVLKETVPAHRKISEEEKKELISCLSCCESPQKRLSVMFKFIADNNMFVPLLNYLKRF